MSANEWRPKVGERVAFIGVVTNVDDDNLPYLVRSDAGPSRWFGERQLSPLPAPAAPRPAWQVLREAAEKMLELGYHPLNQVVSSLRHEANELEAAARPKPPTLAEAVRAYLCAMDERGFSGGLYGDMKEALAREEAAAKGDA